MRTFIYQTSLLLICLCATIGLSAQKQDDPIQDFKSPFKSKVENKPENKKENSLSRKANKVAVIKIETSNGSFGISLDKYILTQQQIESNFKSYFSLSEKNSFKKIKESTDELGFKHINYQQYYNNIIVDGSIVMLHLKNGKPNSFNGKIAAIQNLETTALIDADKALQTAKQITKVTNLINTYPIELLIAQIPSKNSFTQKLVFKVRIDANKPFTMCNVFVDAITGEVVNKISLINDADVQATTNTLYSGTQTITSDSYTGGYRLRDNARKIETYDATNATFGNSTGFTGYSDFSNSTTTWSGISVLNSFTITTVAQNWWYTPLVDVLPDLYFIVKDASNQVVYKSGYYDNTFPTVTFSNLNISLTNPPYSVELWDYDAVGVDDFGGSYTITATTGTKSWSGNGNSGTYTIGASRNPALDVHWGMEKTYDFYKNIFGRNSFDGTGSTIKNFLNPSFLQSSQGNDPNNAFAMPSPYNVMCYGMGDGSFMKQVVALDVTGHEYSHMVVDNNGFGGLTYQAESGALNESFADIFGTCIEFYSRPSNANWLMGEDVMASAPNLRSLSNPNQGYQPQPDTYNGTYWTSTSSTQDHGGVHTNSGVQNYWFYLLSQGGTGTNDLGNSFSVTGIGINQARKIAYKNLTTYIGGANATYLDAYNGSLLAAEAIYGNPSTQYSAVRAAWYAVGIGSDPNSYCSGITKLTETTGTITDGSGTANYGNNANCKWKIAPPGANQITLNFTSFNTEANYDTLFVYDGPDSTYPKLITWWGNTLPSTINSTGGALFIRFVSDNTNNAAGWSLNYTSTGITPSCSGGNVLSTPSGTFSDGSGTNNYGNNQLCHWLIAPPCATSVSLTLTQLNTEANYDGVVVYDGNNTKSPVLGAFSGTTLPSSIKSSGGEMLVVFVSDYSNTGQGFSANYTSTGSSYCSGTTTLSTTDYGTITDGSGASNYCNNSNCSWLIQPPQAASVSLKFTAFDVEAASSDGQSIYDAVEVYNGTSASAPLLGRFSGNNIPPLLTANSGSMFVRFFSDISVNKSGWSANYTSISPSYCNSSTKLTTTSGVITDGSAANQYANNTNCSWLIQPTNAATITLSFATFSTELKNDGVIVYDGANETAPVLGSFTGSTIPSTITSSGGSMYVRFLSNGLIRGTGWTANYTAKLLPLKLLNFAATLENKDVQLKWTATNEVNIKQFEVERSYNGINWEKINTIKSLNKSGDNNYAALDKNPKTGSNFYRLRILELDGKFEYSNIQTVTLEPEINGFSIKPNPAKEKIVIEGKNIKKIRIVNNFGTVVFQKETNISTSQLIEIKQLANGVYFIQCTKINGEVITEKLIITN